jgi:hypothetical protein
MSFDALSGSIEMDELNKIKNRLSLLEKKNNSLKDGNDDDDGCGTKITFEIDEEEEHVKDNSNRKYKIFEKIFRFIMTVDPSTIIIGILLIPLGFGLYGVYDSRNKMNSDFEDVISSIDKMIEDYSTVHNVPDIVIEDLASDYTFDIEYTPNKHLANSDFKFFHKRILERLEILANNHHELISNYTYAENKQNETLQKLDLFTNSYFFDSLVCNYTYAENKQNETLEQFDEFFRNSYFFDILIKIFFGVLLVFILIISIIMMCMYELISRIDRIGKDYNKFHKIKGLQDAYEDVDTLDKGHKIACCKCHLSSRYKDGCRLCKTIVGGCLPCEFKNSQRNKQSNDKGEFVYESYIVKEEEDVGYEHLPHYRK